MSYEFSDEFSNIEVGDLIDTNVGYLSVTDVGIKEADGKRFLEGFASNGSKCFYWAGNFGKYQAEEI